MRINFTLLPASLLEAPQGANEPLDTHRRRLVLQEIINGGATRKRLAISLDTRAGTVTQLVSELIDSGLVKEEEQIRTNGKGRPETMLAFNAESICAVVIRAVSGSLHGTLLDLNGVIHHETKYELDGSIISRPEILIAICDVFAELKRHVCNDRITGVVVSVPGIVDEASGTWLFSSRYPHVAPLTADNLQYVLGTRVTIQRALNAELRARLLQKPHATNETTILLHWGYGIGLSYARNGEVVSSARGAFGEIGHWRSPLARKARCRCGEMSCLETVAALWALGNDLGLGTMSEEIVGQQLSENDCLYNHQLLARAINAVAAAMRDVYLLLVPNHIVITGPFVQSAKILEALAREFKRAIPHYIPHSVTLEAGMTSDENEIIGAAKPLLYQCLNERLNSP